MRISDTFSKKEFGEDEELGSGEGTGLKPFLRLAAIRGAEEGAEKGLNWAEKLTSGAKAPLIMLHLRHG